MAKFPDGHVFIYKPKRTRIEIEERELVMCGSCEHYDDTTNECANTGSPCYRNGWCEPDWFCADGERVDNGN